MSMKVSTDANGRESAAGCRTASSVIAVVLGASSSVNGGAGTSDRHPIARAHESAPDKTEEARVPESAPDKTERPRVLEPRVLTTAMINLARVMCLLVAVVVLASAGCARTSSHSASRVTVPLPNGLYSVLAVESDEASASAAAGENKHVVLIDDGRYVGLTEEPAEWVALSPDPYVPFVLDGEPELGESDKGFASLQIALAPESAKTLETFTADHLNGTVAIVIGGDVITKHKIKAVITGGKLQITRCTDNGCEVMLTKLKEQ